MFNSFRRHVAAARAQVPNFKFYLFKSILMKKLFILAVVSTALLPLSSALAHIGYGGRDLGTWSKSEGNWAVAAGYNGTYSAEDDSVTINVTNIKSDFGWADATDTDWGDSHKGRWFKFTVNEAGTFRITVLGGGTSSGNGTFPYVEGNDPRFLPGFTIYKNLALASTHDWAVLSIGIRRGLGHLTEGSLDALGDFFIANDSNQIGQLEFVGYAVDGTADNFGDTIGLEGDGTADGTVTKTFSLQPGTYSVFVGGANYNGQVDYNATEGDYLDAVAGKAIVYGLPEAADYTVPGSAPSIPNFGASVIFAPIIPAQVVSTQSSPAASSSKDKKEKAKKKSSSNKNNEEKSAKKAKVSLKKSKSKKK